jgi:hypothetical protein
MTRRHHAPPGSYSLEGVDHGLQLARQTHRRDRSVGWWEWVDDLLDRRLQLMRRES